MRDPRKTLETADWDGPGTHRLGPDSLLTVVERSGEADQMTRLMLELVEENRHGTWTTRLYALSTQNSRRLSQVLWFESEGRTPSGKPERPATPRVVRNVLDVVEAYDGSTPVLANPRTMRVDDIDELLGYVTDQQRLVSVTIAAPVPGLPMPTWAKAIETLTRDAVGCASFFLLEPDAALLFNERLGQTHAIPAGALRTFISGVELGDAADARRHRIMTASTLSRNLQKGRFKPKIVELIASTPRRILLESPLPSELTRTERLLQRDLIPVKIMSPAGETAVTLPIATESEREQKPAVEEAAENGSFVVKQPSWFDKLRVLVSRFLGREEINESALDEIAAKFERVEATASTATAKAQELQTERERLEDELATLREQLESEQYERAVADISRREAEAKVRSLEHWRSLRLDKYEYVEEHPAPWESDPASVSDIVERLTDSENYGEILRYVQLSDPDKALDDAVLLDGKDSMGVYASAFWEYVLVIHDYMKARVEQGFSGNLHNYLNAPDVIGRKIPAQRHKANESETVQTNSKMRRERTFTVPREVSPDGKIFMSAHFAPTHRDQNAPRMYYYVDATTTKKAYIGYIGVHLTNTKTS
ncbi:hypothetical protein GCM10027079_23880 [Sediminivirga luteola]|uniref:Uncharacterized protein n=1 Tax=Sediminivirga luteola TaxID=1774748 RepID=A0A8J2U150_9MICO|nr:hypothetical protein GCM10011333_33350 [Sediminivirga luteola]